MNTSRTPAFLMANLGIEVERMHIAKDTRDDSGFVSARERAGRILTQLRAHEDMTARMTELDSLANTIGTIGEKATGHHIPRAEFLAYFAPFSSRVLVVQRSGSFL